MATNADLPMAITNLSTYPPPKPSKKETAMGFGKMDFAPMAKDASFSTTKQNGKRKLYFKDQGVFILALLRMTTLSFQACLEENDIYTALYYFFVQTTFHERQLIRRSNRNEFWPMNVTHIRIMILPQFHSIKFVYFFQFHSIAFDNMQNKAGIKQINSINSIYCCSNKYQCVKLLISLM